MKNYWLLCRRSFKVGDVVVWSSQYPYCAYSFGTGPFQVVHRRYDGVALLFTIARIDTGQIIGDYFTESALRKI